MSGRLHVLQQRVLHLPAVSMQHRKDSPQLTKISRSKMHLLRRESEQKGENDHDG